MVPQTVVHQLAEIVTPRAKFTEGEVDAAMAEAGIPAPIADLAFQFTQAAWGQVFLKRFRAPLAQEFLCFNRDGEIVETGRLAEQPYFAAALELAPQYCKAAGFEALALMSAEVDGIVQALQAGAKLEKLKPGKLAVFTKTATPEGMKKAVQVLTQRAATTGQSIPANSSKAGASARAWWRFWG